MLHYALKWAEMGFYVFPLAPNSKKPLKGSNGFKDATLDATQISKWWTEDPSRNIGIDTSRYGVGGASLAVVDIDPKNGGVESAKYFDLPLSWYQKTPSGGYHRIFYSPDKLPCGTSCFGQGVDFRGDGGYIVAAPSVTPGGNYSLYSDTSSISIVPNWIRENRLSALHQPLKNDNFQALIDGVDQEDAYKHGKSYLINLPLAEEGSRNAEGYKAAAKLKDMGLDFENTAACMGDHWKYAGSISSHELYQMVGSAYRYGKNDPGVAAPGLMFEPIKDQGGEHVIAEEKPARKRLFTERFKNCIPHFNHPYLIKGLLDPNGMSVVYGDSNTGKSFLAIDMAMHIALGKPWMGKKVKQGLVVYVAAEAGASMKNRLFAFREEYHLAESDPDFELIPCQVDLLNPKADTKPLIELIKGLNGAPSLIVIDTLARAMAGGNENQSDHMGAFVRNVDSIRNETGAHLMIIHHSGKDSAKGARGHSSLRAATDTELEVANHRLKITKQRDQEAGPEIGFSLKKVVIGHDSDGIEVTSCVVQAGIPDDFPELDGDFEDAIDMLSVLFMDANVTPERWGFGSKRFINISDWRGAFLGKKYPEYSKRQCTRIWQKIMANASKIPPRFEVLVDERVVVGE